MTPSCLSFPCAMDIGEGMLTIRHACVLQKRFLKFLKELYNQQRTLLVFGLTTVTLACQLSRIHLIYAGNSTFRKEKELARAYLHFLWCLLEVLTSRILVAYVSDICGKTQGNK